MALRQMIPVVDSLTGTVLYWLPADAPVTVPPFALPMTVPAFRLLRPVAAAPLQTATSATPDGEAVNTTVFVRGIPREATTQTVESHFAVFGEIQSCHVIRHKDASTNKGIAFVKFLDAACAMRAIEGTNPGVMDQREIFAEWAHPKPSPSPTISSSNSTPSPHSPSSSSSRIPVPEIRHQSFDLNSWQAPQVFYPGFFPGGSYGSFVNNAVVPSPVMGMAYGGQFSPGGHVLGYPHPGFSANVGSLRNYGRGGSPVYFPVAEYNSGAWSAPEVEADLSSSMQHEFQDVQTSVQPQGSGSVGEEELSRQFGALELPSSSQRSTSESRKGKDPL